MLFDKLANGIQKHAKVILVMWVIALVIAVPFAMKSQEVFKYDLNGMAPPENESIQGLITINTYFPKSQGDAAGMQIMVIEFNDEASKIKALGFESALNDALSKSEEWQKKLSGFLVLGAYPSSESTKGIVIGAAIYTSEHAGSTAYVSADTPNLRAFINDVKNGYEGGDTINCYVTGTPAITYDMMDGAMSDIKKIDPFTILMILILVGLFFRSFITSATPPVTIGVAFVAVLALIYGLGQIFNIFFITEIMLLVSMMGAGCDYCIFVIARYKEELRAGKSHDDALHSAIVWAGESIAISGLSVIIGFGAMAVCDYSLVQTLGLCLALGILVALFAALTLIPSILQITKDRVFWPSRMSTFEEGGKSTKGWYGWCSRVGDRYFHKSARFAIKHAKAITLVAIVVTAPAAYLVVTDEQSYDMIKAMESGDSGKGMDLLQKYANLGMLMPNYIVYEYNDSLGVVQDDLSIRVEVETIIGTTFVYEDVIEGVANIVWNKNATTVSDDLDTLGALIKANDSNIASSQGLFLFLKEYKSHTTEKEDFMSVYKKIIADPNTSNTAKQYLELAMPAIEEYVNEVKEKFKEYEAYISPSFDLNMAIAENFSKVLDWVVDYKSGIIGGKIANDGSEDTLREITYVRMNLMTVAGSMSPTSMKSIFKFSPFIDEYVKGTQSEDLKVVNKWITGTGAVMYDVKNIVSEQFTKIEILVVVLIFLLLLFVMRSWLIPLRSILTILMSICWTMAVTHFVFVTLMGGEIVWLIPMLLLVVCLGLGMDYDILLTTRIKENVMKGMSNDDAIYNAVTHTGAVITVCGLIMGGAFGTLMLSGMEMMKEFGFALCFAIIVDALIVRTYIVPAVIHLLGDWNWKGPGSKVPLPLNKVNTYDGCPEAVAATASPVKASDNIGEADLSDGSEDSVVDNDNKGFRRNSKE